MSWGNVSCPLVSNFDYVHSDENDIDQYLQ